MARWREFSFLALLTGLSGLGTLYLLLTRQVWSPAFLRALGILLTLALITGVLETLRALSRRGRFGRLEGSAATVGLFLTLILGSGIWGGAGPGSTGARWVFRWIYQPLVAAGGLLIPLFLVLALFRRLRFRTWRQSAFGLGLLLSALGGVATFYPFPWLQPLARLREWFLRYPLAGAFRALLVGLAAAGTLMGLRILLGQERAHLEE